MSEKSGIIHETSAIGPEDPDIMKDQSKFCSSLPMIRNSVRVVEDKKEKEASS